MKSKLIILLFLLVIPVSSFSQSQPSPVIIDGDQVSYFQEEGKMVATGGVSMKYKGVELYSDEIEFSPAENMAHIKGNVKIIRGTTTIYGEDITYNFNTYDAKIKDFKLDDPPMYGRAKTAEKIGNEKYFLTEGYVTTCDLENPHWRLKTKKITIYPEDRVEAKNIVLRIGSIPIFYFPSLAMSLKDGDPFPIELKPGKKSEWGYYLLSYWRYRLNEENTGSINLDYYKKRGLAAGIIHKMDSKKYGKLLVKYYLLQDELYAADKRSEFVDIYSDPERVGDIGTKRFQDDRYRAQLSYSLNLEPNFSLRAEIHKFSDEFFMKDFYEREYDVEPNPLTNIVANYSFSNSSISLLGQKRVNVFNSSVEYLPQLQYDFYRQNIGTSKFYFESNNRIGNLNLTTEDTKAKSNSGRFHSFNSFTYINKIGWLNISPSVGAYTVFYSKNKFGDKDLWRVAPKMSIAVSTKLYKLIDADWNLFGEKVSQIRHVITPEIDYSYTHDPTISDDNLFQFDDKDSLAREERIIFTLRNKLQVKNEEKTWDFIFFSPSVEYRLKEEGRGSYFDNVKAKLEIYPREGISLTADTRYDVNTRRVAVVNADITFSKKSKMFKDGKEVEIEKYSVSLGHRYTHLDETQGTYSFRYQVTPKVQLRSYARYEYNRGDLKEMNYAIRTDLHCWWMDVGMNSKEHVRGGKDYTLWLSFTLKAFPEIHVDFDHGYNGAKSSY